MKSSLSRWQWILGTWFGSGLSPVAPGTAGTLAALPLVAVLGLEFSGTPFGSLACGIAAALLFLPGVAAATAIEKATKVHDNGCIVVDEVVGTLLSFGFLPSQAFHHVWMYALGFFLFRVIDVWKPWIIGSSQSLPRGWGVMVDDVLGGLAVGLLLGVLWWKGILQ